MSRITIFTPTYNRENEIKKLYNSLKKQSNMNFEWLIIDDGSTDNTRGIIEEFIKEKIIKISYFYKINEGKHIAFNYAVQKCNTEFIICVDSDDFLLEDDIKNLYENIEELEKDNLGLIFPRKNNINRKENLQKFHLDNIDVMDLKFILNKNIETSILFKKEILIDKPYPKFEGEKFLSEEVLYNWLAKKGKFKFINQYIVESEYLNDGLTKNLYENYSKNFNSTIVLQQSRYEYASKYDFFLKFKIRLKCLININCVCLINGKKINEYSPQKWMSKMLIPISLLWRKMKYDR